MRYILKDGIELCGWNLLPYALVKRSYKEEPRLLLVGDEHFEVLNLCDGSFDFDLPLVSDSFKTIVNQIKAWGVLDEVKEPNLIKKVKYTYYDNRYMNKVHWSVTGKCNAKCKHCYMSAPDAKYGELSHEDAIKIANDIVRSGALKVSLTGGECLVRKDLFDIIDIFIKGNVYIDTIYTNGFLVNEKLLQKFIDRGIYPEFNMSFDGVGHHDWMRGIVGAEAMTNKALKLCHDKGFPTGVEMCIFRANKDTLRKTINHLASLGVRNIKTNPVSNSELWLKNGGGEALTTEELYNIYLEYIPHYYEDNQPMGHVMLGGFFYKNNNDGKFSIPLYHNYKNLDDACVCGHARGTMYIGPDGRGSTCMGICDMEVTKVFPLVQEIGMKKCLTDSEYMTFIDTRATKIIEHNKERCGNCEYKNNCAGGCRAGALGDHPNDLLGIDEYACFLFKGGYIEKIKAAVKSVAPDEKWDMEVIKNN